MIRPRFFVRLRFLAHHHKNINTFKQMQIFSLYNNGMRQKRSIERWDNNTIIHDWLTPSPLFLHFLSSLSITDKKIIRLCFFRARLVLYTPKNDLLKMQIYMFWANKERKRQARSASEHAEHIQNGLFVWLLIFEFCLTRYMRYMVQWWWWATLLIMYWVGTAFINHKNMHEKSNDC